MNPIIGDKLGKMVEEMLVPYQGPKEPWSNYGEARSAHQHQLSLLTAHSSVTRKGGKMPVSLSQDALFMELGHTPTILKPEEAKLKVKRRGIATADVADGKPSSSSQDNDKPTDVKLAVSSRAQKTWSNIFRMASE